MGFTRNCHLGGLCEADRRCRKKGFSERLRLHRLSEPAAPSVPLAAGFLNRLQHVIDSVGQNTSGGFLRVFWVLSAVASCLSTAIPGSPPLPSLPPAPLQTESLDVGIRAVPRVALWRLDQVSKITFSFGRVSGREEKAVGLRTYRSARRQGT